MLAIMVSPDGNENDINIEDVLFTVSLFQEIDKCLDRDMGSFDDLDEERESLIITLLKEVIKKSSRTNSFDSS